MNLTHNTTRDNYYAGTFHVHTHYHHLYDGARLVGEVVYYNYGTRRYQAVYYHGRGHFTKFHTDDWQAAKRFALTGAA